MLGPHRLRLARAAAFSSAVRRIHTPKDGLQNLLTSLGAAPTPAPGETHPAPASTTPTTTSALQLTPVTPPGNPNAIDVDAHVPAVALREPAPRDPAAAPDDDGPPRAPNSPAAAGPSSIPIKALPVEQYKLHVYASLNNTILTLADPRGLVPKRAWFSGGSVGFKASRRAGYEPAYQCAVRMFRRIEEIHGELFALGRKMSLVVCFNDFGRGRDAVYRALLTSEGTEVRPLIQAVSDTTPLKVGGTRAKKMRRL